ncbi:MAG: Crp/Fnr family transcriptional regulator [Lachnospiraceae bacterium]|nr:Crp/Fnr family transcriptional regulator [Lachnospiraceae bacterium]
MNKNEKLRILQKCPLYRGMSERECELAFAKIMARDKMYEKGDIIFRTGDRTWEFGVVLQGTIYVTKEDYHGNQVILTYLEQGDIFAEAFALSGEMMTVNVVAENQCEILLYDKKQVLEVPNMAENLLRIFAAKNVFLTERIEHLSARNLKGKVISFLTDCARRAGSSMFTVPFDRQGMADYLATDRSALSAVLSKLKQEGEIDYWKREFHLKVKEIE